MTLKIPGRETIEIKNVVMDCNGTIAIDRQLIEGVAELIKKLAGVAMQEFERRNNENC